VKTLTPSNIMNYWGISLMSQTTNNVSVEEIWKVLEESGVRRDMLEKLHPTAETLSHLYYSIKAQKTEASKYKYFNR